MDRDRISAITHGDRAFHNPLDPARVAEALDTLGLGPGDRVLDAGCGADLEFVGGPAEEIEPGGAYAAACCLGSLHALGGLERGLGWLRDAVAPGGAS